MNIIAETLTLIAEIKAAQDDTTDPVLKDRYQAMVDRLEGLLERLESQVDNVVAWEQSRHPHYGSNSEQ